MRSIFDGIWKGLLYVLSIVILFGISFAVSIILKDYNGTFDPRLILMSVMTALSFLVLVKLVSSFVKVG